MPAMAHEGQRPLPVLVGQLPIGPGLAHLGIKFIRAEAAAQGHAHQVLHQHVERAMRCAAGLDATLGDGHLGGGGFHYLYAVGGHQGDPRGSPRRVSGAAGALHQPRHALGAPDLQNSLDRQEVHAQIQAGGADHGLERALLEAQFDPVAHLACE